MLPIHDVALNHWASGKFTVRGLARALDVSQGKIAGIIHRARRMGDHRADHRVEHRLFDWTPDRTAHLLRLWEANMSVEAITAALGGGVTTDAVGAKARRMKLAQRRPPGRPSRVAPLVRVKVKEEPRPEPVGKITIVELERGLCHWPFGDPSDFDNFRYCGDPTGEGKRYCSHHFRIAYTEDSIRSASIARKKRAEAQSKRQMLTIRELARMFQDA